MPVFDPRPALKDMASQIRSCRSGDGLTLQQLASRSGVAASTIHKVESQQMVPTVSVLLKIAKGLDRRPDELVRDAAMPPNSNGSGNAQASGPPDRKALSAAPRPAGVWRFNLNHDHALPAVELDDVQRAIVLVERGAVDLQAGERRFQMSAGECLEVEGGRSIETLGGQPLPASVTLIVSPPGNLGTQLGSGAPAGAV